MGLGDGIGRSVGDGIGRSVGAGMGSRVGVLLFDAKALLATKQRQAIKYKARVMAATDMPGQPSGVT